GRVRVSILRPAMESSATALLLGWTPRAGRSVNWSSIPVIGFRAGRSRYQRAKLTGSVTTASANLTGEASGRLRPVARRARETADKMSSGLMHEQFADG